MERRSEQSRGQVFEARSTFVQPFEIASNGRLIFRDEPRRTSEPVKGVTRQGKNKNKHR